MFEELENEKKDFVNEKAPANPPLPKLPEKEEKKLEDIYANQENLSKNNGNIAGNAGKDKPEVFSTVPKNIEKSVVERSSVKTNKKYLTMLIGLISLSIIIALGFWAAGRVFNKPADNEETEIKTSIDVEDAEEGNSGGNQTDVEEKKDLEQNDVVNEKKDLNLDTDQDGLTDLRELELGTDLNNIDSDGDGLFDREEVDVYATDPNNPDSDGDSFSDGGEVDAGYDPNGPGKLYDFNNK